MPGAAILGGSAPLDAPASGEAQLASPAGVELTGPVRQSPPPTTARPTHLYAIDLARVLTVALVVSVHVVSLGAASTTVELGALVIIFHVSREVFFLITAFVLAYSYRSRKLQPISFWRRRYLFVMVPYVTWSAIYFLADGNRLDPVTHALARFGEDLLTGGARYHLYFLLVSMQIYLVFPLLRRLVQKTAGHHLVLFTASALYQLGFSFGVQHHFSPGGVLGYWFQHPNEFLPSYVLYVVAGGIAASHFEELTRFTRRHLGLVIAALSGGMAMGIGVYLLQVLVGGEGPLAASGVFQPVVAVESLAIAWCFLAAGLVWAERGRRFGRAVLAGSDASFGIYLSHPLILQGFLAAAGSIGLLSALKGVPAGVDLAVLVLVVVPLIYAAAGALAWCLRRTPFSLMLTGRSATQGPSGPTGVAPAPPAPLPEAAAAMAQVASSGRAKGRAPEPASA